METLRNLLAVAMLALSQLLVSRVSTRSAPVEIVEPDVEFDSFESFLRYDDVSDVEAAMLFGDDPYLVSWAQRRVMQRTLKCQQVWEDKKKRKALLTGDIAPMAGKVTVDDLEAQLGLDATGYWEHSEDPAEEPVWVEFDETWFGENE